jgi:hypothetical protein
VATNSVPAVRGAGTSLADSARRVPGPARAAGAAAAGLVGGLALGAAASKHRRPAWMPQAAVAPDEVLLDGLTHRRGAHRREG